MNAHALKELLEFYQAAGVDAALGDSPVDRFSLQEPPSEKSKVAARVQSAPVRSRPVDHADEEMAATLAQAQAEAHALAAGAQGLEDLRRALEGFDGCALKKSARRMVFADGNPNARIMLIGEAPGREEDEQGLPFVGRSGQLLDKMLAAIGLDRTKVYIGNVIYWRPPGNRTPTPQERALCAPFIRRQIELVAPKVMMTLGGSALSALFDMQGILSVRGQTLSYAYSTVTIPAVPTLHPSALLRDPAKKRLAWHDLLLLQSLIEEHGAL